MIRIYFLYFFLVANLFIGQTKYTNPLSNQSLEDHSSFIIDTKSDQTILTIKDRSDFLPNNGIIHNFGITSAAVWFKLPIKNETTFENLILQVNQPIIDEIEFYHFNRKKNAYDVVRLGEYKSFNERTYQTPEYLFDIEIPKDSTDCFYLRVKCKENMQVPIQVGTRISVLNSSSRYNLASGIYFGIMIVMILYNLFIFATLRDRSYILYSLYIVLTLLTQTSLQGFTFQLGWPNTPWMAIYSPFLFPTFVGIIGLEFFKHFLKIKERKPRAYKWSFVFLVPYFISIGLSLLGYFNWSFAIMETTAAGVSIFMLTVAALVYRGGFPEARFFLVGWSMFLLGVCIYVLKDFGILPYNGFTRYTMHFGSAAEVILLSFALADKINILKKEKETSQAEALSISLENQKLIEEQNIILEQKVHERTIDLEKANLEVNLALTKLKDAQIQLVDSEKMASLGQLTAGIAHEINNPINFVIANIKPLRMDIQELMELINKYEYVTPGEESIQLYKEIELFKKKIDLDYMKIEIDKILTGIDDGARRTAEIVAGLKNFSRLDESDVKQANINDGIESTLILLRSTINGEISVLRQLSDLPPIECYPGKLNQVFMNLFSNAIYALNKKTGTDKKYLKVSTLELGERIEVIIEDNGIGMSKAVREKIFEPFFTTKDVGEGTGLGMSIVFKIIESHHAKIEVESEENHGTMIKIILNKKIK